MEIIEPEPIWKLNFSGDDTDLVNIISSNLEEEQANDLISLLKEKPGKEQKESLDEDITSLLSKMYINMYGEDMSNNHYIWGICHDNLNDRYYFNSKMIDLKEPYSRIFNKIDIYTYWDAYVISSDFQDLKHEDIFDKHNEELFMICKEEYRIKSFPFTTFKDLTAEMVEENEIKFYYHGEEINYKEIDISKYKDEYINWFTYIIADSLNGTLQGGREYYSTIYESFPEQRIGVNSFTK